NLSAEQLATLPSKWVDDPYTVSAPGAAAPPESAPAETAPENPAEAEAPAEAPPAVNFAPARGFQFGGHVDAFGQNAVAHMSRAGMTWVKRQMHVFQDYSGAINEAHANGFRI